MIEVTRQSKAKKTKITRQSKVTKTILCLDYPKTTIYSRGQLLQ